MPVKTLSRFRKKQAPTNIPRGSARKPAAGNTKPRTKSVGNKSQKNSSKSSAKYSSLKSKQMAVESAKRSIWASMQDITNALINHATTGNLSTAKELFDFAGGVLASGAGGRERGRGCGTSSHARAAGGDSRTGEGASNRRVPQQDRRGAFDRSARV